MAHAAAGRFLLAGVLNDRFGPVLPTVLCFVLRIVVCAALPCGAAFWITAPLAVVFARRVSAFALLGTVSGLITMVHRAAGGIGALAGAWVFDAHGSYTHAFAAMLLLSVAALGFTALLSRRTAR